MKTRKLLAMLLTFAMMMGLLCTGAAATGVDTTIVPANNNNPGVNTIVANAPVAVTCGAPSTTTSSFQYNNRTYNNTQYTYNISVPAPVADNSSVSITINPTSPAIPAPVPPIPQFFAMIGNHGSNPYTSSATITNGTATIVMYVHKDFANIKNYCDTYTFNFVVEYPVSISTSDPVYIEWTGVSGSTVTGEVAGINGSSYMPQSFTLWAASDDILVDNEEPDPITPDPSGSGNYYCTVSPKAVGDTSIVVVVNNITYSISCGPYTQTQLAAGTAPYDIVSYLPIGQYATGSGWGCATKTVGGNTVDKFVSGLESTGVSLGALGGYIEFDFDNPATEDFVEGITNDPRNPYGVDFVVYGNAFNGNPEAGAVQVGWEHGGTVTWYELAGSRYYDDNYTFVGNQGATGKYVNAYSGTLRNTSVNYALGTDIQVTLGSNGPNTFTTNTTWWPTTTEYPEFNVATYPTSGSAHTGSGVTVAYNSGSTLSFGGVTAVQDSNVTADYAFGYADVTPNGSPSSLGDAVNPYTAYTSNKTGGDGFDLEWAVHINNGTPLTADEFYEPDNNGNPTTALKRFRYVRVYSAVLDNATFNETSTEVCGIFTAYRDTTETNNVGRTATPIAFSVTVIDEEEEDEYVFPLTVPSNRGTANVLSNIVSTANNVSAETIDISVTAVSGANIYVNGTLLDETGSSGTYGIYTGSIFTPSSGQYLRVIVQAGIGEPYLFLYA